MHDRLRLPGSSRDWTAEDRAILDAIKARVGDKTVGAQYRLDDHRDLAVMRAASAPDMECPECSGWGYRYIDPCEGCSGTGRVESLAD